MSYVHDVKQSRPSTSLLLFSPAAASTATTNTHLQLESAENYRALSASGCITLEGVDDGDRFKAIQDAFTTVGVESDAQMQVCLMCT